MSTRVVCCFPPGSLCELATPGLTGLGLGWKRLGSTSVGLIRD